jgi:hypothetical protein
MMNTYKLQTKTGLEFREALNLQVPDPVVENWPQKKQYYVYDNDILIKDSPFKTFLP